MDVQGLVDRVSGIAGGDPGKLVGAVSGLIGNSSDLSDLVSKLSDNGLGKQVRSWVGTGSNDAADPDQLAGALGSEKVHEVATEAGVTDDHAKTGIAAVLPQLFDQLTPDGDVPASGVGGVLQGLKGMLG
jgi:uncharacterized protein YidB (DUF937 family)